MGETLQYLWEKSDVDVSTAYDDRSLVYTGSGEEIHLHARISKGRPIIRAMRYFDWNGDSRVPCFRDNQIHHDEAAGSVIAPAP